LKKLIFLFTLSSFLTYAQNIKGVVLDKNTNLGIENVNIISLKKTATALTDEDGKFNLKLKNEIQYNDSIYFSHVGYITKGILISEFKMNNFSIQLETEIENLKETTIYNHKNLKSKISYTKLSNLKKGIYSFGSVLIDGKIYVIGGDTSFESDAFKKLQYENPDFTFEDYTRELAMQFSGNVFSGNLYIYNIKQDYWEKSTADFRKRAYHNLNYYDHKIYVIGGRRRSRNGVYDYLENTIELYDLKNKTIEIDKTNPHQATNFSSFTYKDNIILLGGSTKSNEKGKKIYSKEVHNYDTKSGYWYKLEDMPNAKETSGVLVGDKIYLIGGYNNKPLTEITTLDLITGKWDTIGNLPYAMEKPALTVNNDTIYIFENGKISTFDINSKNLKEYLIDLPMKASQLYFYNDTIYLLGGSIENYYSKSPSANLYSIDLNEFTTTKIYSFKTL
tara:strand:+ start:374 stop:1717 length:1344 start_codon:yes stop_codon:yes gene_type:complete